jgi:hypothetical protein
VIKTSLSLLLKPPPLLPRPVLLPQMLWMPHRWPLKLPWMQPLPLTMMPLLPIALHMTLLPSTTTSVPIMSVLPSGT